MKPGRTPLDSVLRTVSVLFAVLAVLGIGTMLTWDAAHGLRFSAAHQHAAAFPLLFVGLSYMALQTSGTRGRGERARGVSLSLAFVLWGSEQLLPASVLVTIMDCLVVTIFVIDLTLAIVDDLKRGMGRPS